MKIIKYKQFNSTEEFEQWQTAYKPEIIGVTPKDTETKTYDQGTHTLTEIITGLFIVYTDKELNNEKQAN